MFRDMKDSFRMTKEGMGVANEAMRSAQESGMLNPSGTTAFSGQVSGTATVDAVADTGMVVNGAPVLELSLTVTLPARPPYPVKHRQLMAHGDLARFQPGAVMPVNVSHQDPSQVMFG
jgi:hypothetical protein